VVTYDQAGTGRLRSTELPSGYAIADMADQVVEVLDATKTDTCHFVGHALGGLAGIDLALRTPRRLRSLTVVNGWATADAHTRRCFEVRVALLKGAGEGAYVRAQPIFLYPATWISENTERLDAEEEHMVKGFPATDVMLARIEALLAFDIDAKLRKIMAQVLVSASADDMLVPVSCSKRLAERLPNATLDITPWGGHGMSVTDPDVFNSTLVEFLSS